MARSAGTSKRALDGRFRARVRPTPPPSLAADQADRVRRHRRSRWRHRQSRPHRPEHHHQVQARPTSRSSSSTRPAAAAPKAMSTASRMPGDPHKVVFGTSNAWQQPMVSKVAFKHTDLTPIAAMAQDEFLLWVKQDAPYQNVQDYLEGRRRQARRFQDGRRAIEGHRRSAHPADREGREGEVHLHPVQERRRSRGAARRRSHRFARQQSERKPRPMARRHATSALRVQPAAPARRAEDHRDRRLARHSDLRRIRPRTSRSSSSRAPCGCPARSRPTRSPSMST